MSNLYEMWTGAQANGAARVKQSQLAGLVNPAIGGDKAAQSRMIGLDPEMGMKVQGFADTRAKGQQDAQATAQKRLGGLAAGVVQASQAGDPASVQGAYQALLQEARAVNPQAQLSDAFDPKDLPEIHKLVALGGGLGTGQNVQSTYIDAQGNRVAIMRDGSTQVLGQNAPNTQIIAAEGGYFGINKGNLNAAPVQIGGQPQRAATQAPRAPGEVPYSIDPSLPPEVQAAIRANESQFANAPDGSNLQIPQRQASQSGGGQLRPAPKVAAAPAGFRNNPDGTQSVIAGGPAEIAQAARAEAAAARQAAEGVKTSLKQKAEAARQVEASTAANHLISQIDSLTSHPGFADLGTVWGDTQINTPLIRNDAKDARAKLENIGGQVALSTMARLKSLSSTGATGFGSLTAPELKLLQNSIDTLQSENISNKQLTESLANIRKFMDKTSGWKPSVQGGGAAPKAVNSQAQYDALPSGAIYLEDGQQYRKP